MKTTYKGNEIYVEGEKQIMQLNKNTFSDRYSLIDNNLLKKGFKGLKPNIIYFDVFKYFYNHK